MGGKMCQKATYDFCATYRKWTSRWPRDDGKSSLSMYL